MFMNVFSVIIKRIVYLILLLMFYMLMHCFATVNSRDNLGSVSYSCHTFPGPA